MALLLIGFGLYLLGFMIAAKAYGWLAVFPGNTTRAFITAVHSVGSVGLIFATMAQDGIYRRLDGRVFRTIGAFSFPLYLAASVPLSRFDMWWVRAVNDVTKRLLRAGSGGTGGRP